MASLKMIMPNDIDFLILDDMASIRKTLTSALRVLGFKGKLLEAECVADAEAILEKNSVDFILSDWNLPDGTGLKFLQKIRTQVKFQKIPFIMITTEDGGSNMLAAIRSGANNYIVKSKISGQDLLDKINSSWETCHG